MGSAVANGVVVVGNHVLKAPTMRIDRLDQHLRAFAEDVGRHALHVGKVTAHTAVRLAQVGVCQR